MEIELSQSKAMFLGWILPGSWIILGSPESAAIDYSKWQLKLGYLSFSCWCVNEVKLLNLEDGSYITELSFSLDVNTLRRILQDSLTIPRFSKWQVNTGGHLSDSKLCALFSFCLSTSTREVTFFISCETTVYIFWNSGKGNQKRCQCEGTELRAGLGGWK